MAFSTYEAHLVGDKIRGLREELGLTREEVARSVPHLTVDTLRHIEESVDRISNPSLRQLRQIATVLKTTAHELGHWVLQSSGSVASDHGTAVPHAVVERWCDHFAAALLMPRAWVVQGLRRAKLSGLLRSVLSAPPVYQVSHQAFRLRISELTPVSLFQLRQKEGAVSIELRYETNDQVNILFGIRKDAIPIYPKKVDNA